MTNSRNNNYLQVYPITHALDKLMESKLITSWIRTDGFFSEGTNIVSFALVKGEKLYTYYFRAEYRRTMSSPAKVIQRSGNSTSMVIGYNCPELCIRTEIMRSWNAPFVADQKHLVSDIEKAFQILASDKQIHMWSRSETEFLNGFITYVVVLNCRRIRAYHFKIDSVLPCYFRLIESKGNAATVCIRPNCPFRLMVSELVNNVRECELGWKRDDECVLRLTGIFSKYEHTDKNFLITEIIPATQSENISSGTTVWIVFGMYKMPLSVKRGERGVERHISKHPDIPFYFYTEDLTDTQITSEILLICRNFAALLKKKKKEEKIKKNKRYVRYEE